MLVFLEFKIVFLYRSSNNQTGREQTERNVQKIDKNV